MTDQNDNFVSIRNLTFKRGERFIFNDVDVAIRRGKITAFMGPSGCGKTTLLRLIGAQVKPLSGIIEVAGQNVPELSRDDLFKLRARMGMLFQSGALFTDLSVFENVAFPLRVHTRLPEAMIRDIVLLKLQAVGLRGARDLMPHELSGGMQRRVALARAIALDPEMVMYDEPFAGQDPMSMGVLLRLIKMLNTSLGLTSIIVSHDLHETASIADYIYLISNGKIIAHGEPDDLMHSQEPMVRQFMQGESDGPVPFHFPAADYTSDLLGN